MKASPPPPPTEQPPPSILGPSATPTEPVSTGPKVATWPEWLPAVDLALAVMALVIAFLAASFAARNSDLWLHLANGRMIAHGDYSPGHDPFSFTGAARPWVDSSWLFDLLLYAAYSMDDSGGLIVVLKALVFTAALGGLFFLRKSEAAGWPWAFFVGIAALASAPYASLRPVTASMLFLTATLLVIYRWPLKGKWSQPAAVGALFWLWACTDSLFLLGPVTLGLVLLGEWLNRLFLKPEAAGDDWFLPTPPAASLGRALGLGVLGCLLNPMFLAAVVQDPGEAVCQLIPTEIGFGVPPGAASDPDLLTLVQSPLDDDFWSRKFGKEHEPKLNAIAWIVLANAGNLALLLTVIFTALFGGSINVYSRFRFQHALLLIAFNALALLHVRLIPFCCIVSVPIAAWYLNGLSSTIRLGIWADPKTRILLTASAFGRVMCVIAFLIAIASAYPGWLHAPSADPTYERAYINRVDWAIDPDPGLVRTTKLLEKWRTEEALPADLRGIETSIELANYCAWYAPSEKVFANGRYGFHRSELPDLMTVREIVVGKKNAVDLGDQLPDYEPLLKVCEKYDVGYLAVASGLRRINEFAILTMLQDQTKWDLWHIDGRSCAIGNAALKAKYPKAFEKLYYNASRVGFGPDVKEIPEGKLVPAPVFANRSMFVDGYIERPSFPPIEADDASVWGNYAMLVSLRMNQAWQREAFIWELRRIANAAFAGVAMSLYISGGPPVAGISDEQFAIPVMMSRAARTAIAEQPDRPDGHSALVMAYRQPLAAVLDAPLPAAGMSERELQIITAQVRFLERVPPVENCPPRLARLALTESSQLANTYEQTGQLDFARNTLAKALALAKSLPAEVLAEFVPEKDRGTKSAEDVGKSVLQSMETAEERLTRITQLKGERVSRLTGITRKFQEAQEQGLPARALEIYKNADAEDFGTQLLQVNLAVILMELRAGHIDQAAAYIESFKTELKEKFEGKRSGDVQYTQEVLKQLTGIKSRLEGNYPAAAEALNAAKFQTIPKAEVEKAVSQPRALLGLMGLVGPVDVPIRVGTAINVQQELLSESAYQYDRGLLAMNGGDLAEAKKRFELAMSPQGADLTRLNPELAARAFRYLEMIKRYHK